MSRRQEKSAILALLQDSSLEAIYHNLSSYPEHRLINLLFSALCHPVEKVKWHAVCAFGWLVPKIAERDLEAARIVMRRFLWSLNDESAGIGWGAPEAMAEIMCRSSVLRSEYLHMLISYLREDGEALFEDGNYLELPMLQRGLLWGIGRLCQEHRQEMVDRQIGQDLRAYLDSRDMHVVALAIWCLGLLGMEISLEQKSRLSRYKGEVELFLNDEIRQVSIADLVLKLPSN